MDFSYRPHGVCASGIQFDVAEGAVSRVTFVGGCEGNHSGLASLVEGMPIEEVISRLSGITCGGRKTSCPDQLAQALKAYLKENESKKG